MKKVITLKQISELVHGELKGNPDIEINDITSPEKWRPNTISPLWEKKYLKSVKPETILFTEKGWINESNSGVEVQNARVALIALLKFFDDAAAKKGVIDSRAVIAEDAKIDANVSVAAGAVVKSGAKIGSGTVIMENAVISEDAEIGCNCLIEHGAVIYRRCVIGDNCVIHSNASIGCEGFGFVPDAKSGMVKIPQVGIVRLDDGVEIGACSSIDRATFGETHIGTMTKIDSHVKVGHNCEIGAFTIMVAQSGVAGSTKIGNRVIMAAQSGAGNHCTIGDGCTIAGRAGVSSDVPANSVYSGFPAQEHKKELRKEAHLRRLPETAAKVKDLEKRVAELENKHEDA